MSAVYGIQARWRDDYEGPRWIERFNDWAFVTDAKRRPKVYTSLSTAKGQLTQHLQHLSYARSGALEYRIVALTGEWTPLDD